MRNIWRPSLSADLSSIDSVCLRCLLRPTHHMAIGNDYVYERLFVRQLLAQARPGDVFVGITTSGKSPNKLCAIEICKELQAAFVALCGLDGQLEGLVDCVLRASSHHTPRIQECHILIGHMICAEVEMHMFVHLAPIRV